MKVIGFYVFALLCCSCISGRYVKESGKAHSYNISSSVKKTEMEKMKMKRAKLTFVKVSCSAHKMKFFVKDFFSKCWQIHRFLQIWSNLLKKSFLGNFSFGAVMRLSLLRRVSLKVPGLYFL